MSALDKIRRGKRLTADFLYELLYGIANGDLATQNNNLPYWRNKVFVDHVIEGCIWTGDSYGSTLLASMSAGLVMINGKVVSVDAIANRAFTASKDTYHYIDENGASTFTEVANNAASPTAVSNAILNGIIVTGASNIANEYSINMGRIANNTARNYLPVSPISPTSSTIVDSNGIRIHPTDPLGKLVSSTSRTAATNTGAPGGSSVAWNGMQGVVFQAEPYTNYRFSFHEPALSGYSAAGSMIWEFYLATTNSTTYTTTLNEVGQVINVNDGVSLSIAFNSGSYSGKTYLNMKIRSSALSGTTSINTDSTRTGIYTIEKM